MGIHDQLIAKVRSRKAAGQTFGQGFWTADRYASSVVECVGPAVCKRYFPGQSLDTPSMLKEAGEKLTYCGDDLIIEAKATSAADILKELGDGGELPKHAMMLIKHVLTTPREDRDTDILETGGAKPDLKMPLLWQHIHTLPIGKLFRVLEHSNAVLRMATVLLDLNDLTADAAKLVEADALRFSHGFRALQYVEHKTIGKTAAGEQIKSYRITEFEIMEESLVSVPSNVDAEIELYSRGKLKSDAFKMHAKRLADMRPKQFKGIGSSFGELKTAVEKGAISLDAGKEIASAMLEASPSSPQTERDHGCGCEGDCQCDGGLPLPDEAAVEPEAKSYAMGATVKLSDGSQGPISKIKAGPAYAVSINGTESKWHFDDELALVQGADNGSFGEMNEAGATPRSKGMAAGGISRKMFDPAKERLEPSSTELDWAARFIGCGVKDLCILQTGCGGIMRGGFMAAFDTVTKTHKIDETRNMSGSTERPPEHETIDISSSERRMFLTEGFRFMTSPDGWKYAYRTFENWGSQFYAIYADDHAKAQKLIDDAWEDLDRNSPLKGEAFGLTTGFLKRNGLDWSEIFLDEKNETSLKRTVRIVNTKGASAANKGVILQGPPGTGKTLGSRVMMNQASATFIWVAAKDFWRAGRYGCFSDAFSLARKLAPSIILFEDVDNYIDSDTVDLLKSEMDGLSQSSGVTTLLTTNFPERLPAALIDRPGRFHDVLEFGLPSKEIRRTMLEKWATDASLDAVCDIAEKTEGLSGAHVFELAAFAKTIRDEDECGMDEALVKALAKVHEQRELINQNQLAGSSYRHSRRDTGVSTKMLPLDLVEDSPLMLAEFKAAKAGRTLSQRNLSRLQEVHDTLDDMETMKDLAPRAAKTLAKSAKAVCKAMMEECQPEESSSEDSGKAAEPMTAERAFQLLLAEGDPLVVKRIHDATGMILDVQRSDAKAAAYRKLMRRSQ